MSDAPKHRWLVRITDDTAIFFGIVTLVALCAGEPDLLDAIAAKWGGITLKELHELRKTNGNNAEINRK